MKQISSDNQYEIYKMVSRALDAATGTFVIWAPAASLAHETT